MLVNATASYDRTEVETAIADSAPEFRVAYARERQAGAAALQAEQADLRAKQEAERARSLLETLERRGTRQMRRTMRKLVKDLVHAAAGAGDHLDAQQLQQIDIWTARVDIARPPKLIRQKAPAERTPPRRKPTSALYEQVEQGSWYHKPCPRCRAAKGKACLNDDGIGNGSHRQLPHDERLRLIIGERKPPAKKSPKASTPRRRPSSRPAAPRTPPWNVLDVACPTCNAGPGTQCKTPNRHPHQPRVARFRRRFPSG